MTINTKTFALIIVACGICIFVAHLNALNTEKEKYVDGMNEFADYWCKTQPSEYDIVRGYYNESVCIEPRTLVLKLFILHVYVKETNRTLFNNVIVYRWETRKNKTYFTAHFLNDVIDNENEANEYLIHRLGTQIDRYSAFEYDLSISNSTYESCDEFLWIPDKMIAKSYFDGGTFDEDYELNEHISVTNAFVCYGNIFVPPLGNGITYTADWW